MSLSPRPVTIEPTNHRAHEMSDMRDVPELPFPVTASQVGLWARDEQSGAVVAAAAAHTDFYINPGGVDSPDAESLLNAATLLGTPPDADFQFSARITVDFQSQYDAGVLFLWVDEQHWAKFCFEFSPAAEPETRATLRGGWFLCGAGWLHRGKPLTRRFGKKTASSACGSVGA